MNINLLFILLGIVFSAIMIGVTYQINSKSQPRQLWMLFFTEMWERFSFYGMRALLILYMTNQLMMDDKTANLQYGSYNALVYTLPLLGGWMADKILGYRKSIILGGILMAIGHLVLALPQQSTFYLGLGFLITGNGFFKPNISSFLGTYYDENDDRKDTGYSIFYMGVNIGAFLGSMICGYLGNQISWHLGFGIAGIFMILGLIVFVLNRKILGDQGYSPVSGWLNEKVAGIPRSFWIYAAILLLVPLDMLMVTQYSITTYIMVPLGIISALYIIYISFQYPEIPRHKLWAATLLITSVVLFWGFYEQQGGSLNLMAQRNVNFQVGSSTLDSAMMNNSVNPFYIIFLTPLLSIFWNYLIKKKINFNTSLKFGTSFLLVALGYYILYLGGVDSIELGSGLMPLFYFLMAYLFITLGELFISPIGLSMVSKLSPSHMFGFMFGFWFLASALGHKLAAWIGTLMAIPEEIVHSEHYNPLLSMPIYMDGCKNIAIASLITGFIILLLSNMIQKWMHNVK